MMVTPCPRRHRKYAAASPVVFLPSTAILRPLGTARGGVASGSQEAAWRSRRAMGLIEMTSVAGFFAGPAAFPAQPFREGGDIQQDMQGFPCLFLSNQTVHEGDRDARRAYCLAWRAAKGDCGVNIQECGLVFKTEFRGHEFLLVGILSVVFWGRGGACARLRFRKRSLRTGQDHIRQTLLPTTCSWNMSVQDPHCAPAEAGLIIFAAVNKELVHSGVFFGMVNTPERIIAVKAGFPAFP